jgi:hypothetical protein
MAAGTGLTNEAVGIWQTVSLEKRALSGSKPIYYGIQVRDMRLFCPHIVWPQIAKHSNSRPLL